MVNSPRHVNQLSAEAAAYIAGLIDGEGTITLTRLHTNENRRLVISIANTELALLKFVIEHPRRCHRFEQKFLSLKACQ